MPADRDALGDAVAWALASGEAGSLLELYDPGARLETNLPGRSASVHGRAPVLEALVAEGPASIEILGRRRSRGGLVLRVQSSVGDAPVKRRRHLIHLRRGRVGLHVVYPERTPPERLPTLPEPSGAVAARAIGAIRERSLLEPGISGCLVERWRLDDGRVVFAKHLRHRDSWLMRASDDRGREAELFRSGILAAIEPLADHAVIAAEPEEGGWLLMSEDRTAALARPPRTPAQRAGLFALTRRIGERLRGLSLPSACPIAVRLGVFSPGTALRERDGSDLAPKVIGRGWELFDELAPAPVASAVMELARDPAPLVAALAECPATVVHGDLRTGNVGWSTVRPVLVDWGLAMVAPPILDLTWWLFNAGWRGASSLDRMLQEIRAGRPDAEDRQVGLGMLASLVQAGSYFGFEAAQNPDPSARLRARTALTWWSERALEGLAVL